MRRKRPRPASVARTTAPRPSCGSGHLLSSPRATLRSTRRATLGWLISPESLNTPLIHLFSGATMLGAFFIATDPVTASTTNRGRLLYGALIGLLVWLIRSFGGYPDGVAFAVLLANICVPLIDYYTQPRVYGHRKE